MNLKKWLLELPGVGKIRRVHALEHATITLISHRLRHAAMVGHSNHRGFWLYGNIEIAELERGVEEALRRLQAGEASLALHPNCGTNIAVGGILTGVSSFLAMLSFKKNDHILEKLSRMILFATCAMFFAKPFGMVVQEGITTCPDASRLSLGKIQQTKKGALNVYFVEVLGAL